MHSTILLASLLASAASLASADGNIMAGPVVRHNLQPRQSLPTDLPASCTSALLGLARGIPTPGVAIIADQLRNPQTNPCSFSTPSRLSSQYSSYSSAISSWVGDNEDDIEEAASDCPQLLRETRIIPVCSTEFPGLFSTLAAIASTATATGSGSGTETTSGTDTGTTSGSGSETTTDTGTETTATNTDTTGTDTTAGTATTATTTGGAPRETGMAMAALAAAGLVAAAL